MLFSLFFVVVISPPVRFHLVSLSGRRLVREVEVFLQDIWLSDKFNLTCILLKRGKHCLSDSGHIKIFKTWSILWTLSWFRMRILTLVVLQR